MARGGEGMKGCCAAVFFRFAFVCIIWIESDFHSLTAYICILMQADQYCTSDKDKNYFAMLLVRVCLGSSVGSTGRDGEADPVVPSLTTRMLQKMGVGNPSRYFRSARAVASKMSKVDLFARNKGVRADRYFAGGALAFHI